MPPTSLPDTWKSFKNAGLNVTLRFPGNWRIETGTRASGPDGFFELSTRAYRTSLFDRLINLCVLDANNQLLVLRADAAHFGGILSSLRLIQFTAQQPSSGYYYSPACKETPKGAPVTSRQEGGLVISEYAIANATCDPARYAVEDLSTGSLFYALRDGVWYLVSIQIAG